MGQGTPMQASKAYANAGFLLLRPWWMQVHRSPQETHQRREGIDPTGRHCVDVLHAIEVPVHSNVVPCNNDKGQDNAEDLHNERVVQFWKCKALRWSLLTWWLE